MATYGDIKEQFKKLLSRRDITPSLVETFMEQGLLKTQRILRVPSMEAFAEITDTDGVFDLPTDFLAVITLDPGDSAPLTRGATAEVFMLNKQVGNPLKYTRNANKIILGPVPSGEHTYYLTYYRTFPELTSDVATNWLTDSAPDVLIYGALVKACEFYLDARKDQFDASYMDAVTTLMEQSMQDELTNASMGASYLFSDGG